MSRQLDANIDRYIYTHCNNNNCRLTNYLFWHNAKAFYCQFVYVKIYCEIDERLHINYRICITNNNC